MIPLPKEDSGLDVKVINNSLTTFKQKQLKKWDQNVSRAKIFIVKFKKLVSL